MPQTVDSAFESENIRPDEPEQRAERPQSLPIPETNQEKVLEEHDSKSAMAQGEDGSFECEECGVKELLQQGSTSLLVSRRRRRLRSAETANIFRTGVGPHGTSRRERSANSIARSRMQAASKSSPSIISSSLSRRGRAR
jgi:hypothetical protein